MHGNTILPLKEDNLSITVKLAGSKVSIIQKFYGTYSYLAVDYENLTIMQSSY